MTTLVLLPVHGTIYADRRCTTTYTISINIRIPHFLKFYKVFTWYTSYKDNIQKLFKHPDELFYVGLVGNYNFAEFWRDILFREGSLIEEDYIITKENRSKFGIPHIKTCVSCFFFFNCYGGFRLLLL